MPEFSEITEKSLKNAGWFPGRRVDTSGYKRVLSDNENPLHECAQQFLSEFGGLHVQTPKKGQDFQIDPALATKNYHIDAEGLSDYNSSVGTPLCCIGVASRALMLLLMDRTGRVFAVIDDLIFLAGHSPRAALELLCSGDQLPEFNPEGMTSS